MYFKALLLVSMAISTSATTSPQIARVLRAVAARVPAVETSLTLVAPLPSFSSSSVEPPSFSFLAPALTSSAAPSSKSTALETPIPRITSEAPTAPTSASVAPTSAAPAKPTITRAALPAVTSTASSSDNSLLTATHTGDATFYATGLGACGIVNEDSDFIAAVSHILFDEFPGYNGANPNNNPICNKKATADYNGNEVAFTITDRCEACDEFSLNFSPAAFSVLANEEEGRLHNMTWHFD
ncbi:hypothetical protein EW026_g3998 [Hermanssonia centrifuga]|uniref:RlpA-like protein double-psi beta-barrel domain-containing protein n=1 Tax=Hermanssonia centrifuga TaxID=98765 RepID=A0A4S4KN41_9APHY|nr:hypothetical protein EW026_g3998 [Hermanssonia centrifuga]